MWLRRPRLSGGVSCSVMPYWGYTGMMKMMRIGMGLLLLALALPAGADKLDAVRKQVEASMVLTGILDVSTEGEVEGYTVDKADQVQPAALELLSKHVPQWKFEPVLLDGKAVRTRSRMRVRLVATQLPEGDYVVSIKDSDFPPMVKDEATWPVSIQMRRPKYPETPLSYGVSASAYVVARVGASGEVEDAWVEQVNLGSIGEERDMALWRKQFGEAVVKAAKASRFKPRTTDGLSQDAMSVRIPYSFQLSGAKSPTDRPYGQWSAYVPGPRQSAPWLSDVETGAPDLLAAGENQALDGAQGLKRLAAPKEG